MGLQTPWLAKRAVNCASDLAGERSAGLRGVGVDSEYERNDPGEGVPVGSAGTAVAGTAHNVFVQSENQSARKNRTRRQARIRTCQPEPTSKKADRRTGAATLWTERRTFC